MWVLSLSSIRADTVSTRRTDPVRGYDLHPRLRITALSVYAGGVVIRGLAYLGAPPPSTQYTTFVDAVVPLQVWALVWVGSGALLLAGIWNRVIARWALSIGASLWGVWALSYTLSWIVGDQSRAWVTAGAMATIAGSMWLTAALADSAVPPPGPVIRDDGEEDAL